MKFKTYINKKNLRNNNNKLNNKIKQLLNLRMMIKTSIASIAMLVSNSFGQYNHVYETRTPAQLREMAATGEAFQA